MPELTWKQKFLQWQYEELCNRIAASEGEAVDESLIEAMNEEKGRMEDEYDLQYGVRPPPPPPPRPPWW